MAAALSTSLLVKTSKSTEKSRLPRAWSAALCLSANGTSDSTISSTSKSLSSCSSPRAREPNRMISLIMNAFPTRSRIIAIASSFVTPPLWSGLPSRSRPKSVEVIVLLSHFSKIYLTNSKLMVVEWRLRGKKRRRLPQPAGSKKMALKWTPRFKDPEQTQGTV